MSHKPRREFLSNLAKSAAATGLMSAIHAQHTAPAQAAQNQPRRRIKVGQIGTSHAHASKLGVYRRSADYDVVGIVEPNSVLRRKAEQQTVFQGLTWMTQEQLLNVPDLEAVLVETHVRDLLKTAETCVAAGKHVHIDKPAGSSLPLFQRVLQSAEKRKLLVQMGYMYRYNPGVVLLREFLKSGWLGEIFEVHTVMSKVVPASDRRELAEFDGGIMFELGCHVLDLVLGVLGKPQKVTPFLQRVSPQVDNLADNTLAVLSYPRALATVKSSANEVDGTQRRHFVVCGTEGTFHIQPLDSPAARVTLSKPHGKYARGYQDITLAKYTRYEDDAADMARIVRGEKASDFSYQHDLDVQTTLLQACNMSLDA